MWLLTLKSVLLATDLGEASLPALRTAAELARLSGASLHIVHVADRAIQGEAGQAMLRDHLAGAVPDAPEPASTQVLYGGPTVAIVERAMEVEADAIILGRHRPGHSPEGAMGSTASGVVRSAPCPCLVAAVELKLPLERVLVPIDLSEAAGGTLAVALSWTSALRPPGKRAELVVLHVAPSLPAPAEAELVREEVERARASAGDAARVELREQMAAGADPAQEILRLAEQITPEMIVLGSRDEDAVERGGASAAVVRGTPCPVLLVPPVTWRDQGVS
jgi:nucleotide-binding universal stress UspA family protein